MEGYSFRVAGFERKEIAHVLAEILGAPIKYTGPPSFKYEIGGCSIDRNANVNSPVNEYSPKVLTALKEMGATTEENVNIVIPMDKHTGASLRNLVNIISSKDRLLQSALGRTEAIVPRGFVEHMNSVPIETVEDFEEAARGQNSGGLQFDFENKTIGFGFYNVSLDFKEIKAYMALSKALDEQAKRLKYASLLQKEADNEKYAFRCFLLRLGFIGNELKSERKLLMSKLAGNGSYKVKPASEEEESSC